MITFATFARQGIVMIAGRFVPADQTKLFGTLITYCTTGIRRRSAQSHRSLRDFQTRFFGPVRKLGRTQIEIRRGRSTAAAATGRRRAAGAVGLHHLITRRGHSVNSAAIGPMGLDLDRLQRGQRLAAGGHH